MHPQRRISSYFQYIVNFALKLKLIDISFTLFSILYLRNYLFRKYSSTNLVSFNHTYTFYAIIIYNSHDTTSVSCMGLTQTAPNQRRDARCEPRSD